MIVYSYFKVSAGFLKADFIVWDETVRKASSRDKIKHTINIPAPMLVGKE